MVAWMMGVERLVFLFFVFFFFEERLVCPMGFSHFSSDGTVFYSYSTELSMYSFCAFPTDSEQMTEQLLEGEKHIWISSLQKRIYLVSSCPAPSRTVPRTFSDHMFPHTAGRLDWMFHLYIKIKNSNKNLAHMKNRPFGHMVHYAYSFNY